MRVVITGLGVCCPIGDNTAELWQSLVNLRSGIRLIDRFDTGGHATRIAGLTEATPAETDDSRSIVTQSRSLFLASQAADQAWKQSGLLRAVDAYRFGVHAGISLPDLETCAAAFKAIDNGELEQVPNLAAAKFMLNMLSGTMGMRYGLRGPNKTYASACAASAHALGEAMLLLRVGLVDCMLVVGAEAPIHPMPLAMFNRLGALSQRNDAPAQACRPFDLDRDGFVVAEGAAAMVLEREDFATQRGADVLAVVSGYGHTCDVYHILRPDPEGVSAAESMRAALSMAALSPEHIDYINAHATGTPVGDTAEANAIATVFGEGCPKVSSTKALTGHMAGGAGALEAVICALALQHSTLPPQANCPNPDPACAVNLMASEPAQAPIAHVLTNSFGFGGANASLVLSHPDA